MATPEEAERRRIFDHGVSWGDTETRLRTVLESLHEGVVVHDGNGAIVESNAAARRILGVTADQMSGRTSMDPLWRAVHEDGSPFPGSTHPAMLTLATGEPVRDELMGVHKPDGSLTWILINSALLPSSQGIQVMASFTDVTALRSVEQRYRLLAENASDFVYRLNTDGVCEWVSPNITGLLGWLPAEWVEHNLTEFTHHDDIGTNPHTTGPDNGGGRRSGIVRVRHQNGTYLWLELSFTEVCDTAGRVVGEVGSARDINESVQLEAALAQTSAQLRLVLDNTADVVGRLAPDGTLMWVSPSIRSVFGFEPADVVGRRFDLAAPEYQQVMTEAAARAVSAHAEHFSARLRVRCADGSQRWADTHNTLVWNESGEVDSMVMVVRDVSREVAVQQVAQRMLENATDVVFEMDSENTYVWVSPSVTAVLGWTPEQIVGKSAIDFAPAEDLAAIVAARDHPEADGIASVEAFRFRQADGSYRWMSGGSRAVSDESGRLKSLVVGLRDVQALVEARQEATAAGTRLRSLVDALPDPTFVFCGVWDSGEVVDLRYVHVNAAAARLYERSQDEIVGSTLLELFPAAKEVGAFGFYLESLVSGEPRTMRLPGFDDNGVTGSFDLSTSLLGDELVVVARDVTVALAIEQRTRAILDTMLDPHVLLASVRDGAGTIFEFTFAEANAAACEYIGMDPEQLRGVPLLSLLPGQTGRDVLAFCAHAVESQEPVILDDFAFRYQFFEDERHFDIRAVRVEDALSLTWRDVTHRHLQAKALADSEARYKVLAENASDVVVELTPEAVLEWVSPSVEPVLGWRPGKIIGLPIAELIHPDDRESDSAWRTAMTSQGGAPLELRALTANGSYRWVSARTRPVSSADGSLTGWVTGLRDVHEEVRARQALAHSQHRYKLLAENASDVVWQLDADTILRWVTPSIESVLGWSPEELLGTPAIELVHPEDLPALGDWRQRVSANVEVAAFELRVRKADGGFRWMSLHTRPTLKPDGAFDGAIVGLRDVHEQVIAREELARSETMFRLAMDGAPQGMAVVGLHGKFLRVNEALCELVGHDIEWTHEHFESEVIHPDDVSDDLAVRDRLVSGAAEYDIHEARLVTATGEQVWVQHSLALVRDVHDMPLFYVSQYQDITNARASRRELQYRAEHDILTGLINRGQLQQYLADVLERPTLAVGVPGLLYCDLDHFKMINDTHGHSSGDYVLRVVADRIGEALRQGDEVARLGGDEFVVVLPQVADVNTAFGVAQRIRETVAEPLQIAKDTVTLTMSIGIALASPGVGAHPLLRNADLAMYEAKNSGRNQIVVFNSAPQHDRTS